MCRPDAEVLFFRNHRCGHGLAGRLNHLNATDIPRESLDLAVNALVEEIIIRGEHILRRENDVGLRSGRRIVRSRVAGNDFALGGEGEQIAESTAAEFPEWSEPWRSR